MVKDFKDILAGNNLGKELASQLEAPPPTTVPEKSQVIGNGIDAHALSSEVSKQFEESLQAQVRGGGGRGK